MCSVCSVLIVVTCAPEAVQAGTWRIARGRSQNVLQNVLQLWGVQREPRRASGHPIGSDQQARGLGAFDHPLQPQPGRERQPADGVGGRFARVEHHQAELAGLQHELERADCLHQRAVEIAAQPGVRHDEAADPEQPIEVDAGLGRRFHVEHVERIDERDQFAARAGRRQQLEQQARPPRRPGADELGDMAARDAAVQPGV